MRRGILAAAAAVVVAVLAGCVPGGEPEAGVEAPAPTASAPASPSPEAEPTGEGAEPAKSYPAADRDDPAWAALTAEEQVQACDALGVSATCVIEMDECAWTEFAAAGDPDQVAGEKPQIPVDQGLREYATGEAVLDADGTPVAYVVAAGDIPEFVARRLCVGLSYLNAINSVRRASLAGQLFAGDTLNLDATTILSVGDQNGVVSNGTPPSPMPPQR